MTVTPLELHVVCDFILYVSSVVILVKELKKAEQKVTTEVTLFTAFKSSLQKAWEFSEE